MKRTLVVAAAVALVATGCGGGQDDRVNSPAQTVQVDMVDIGFHPATFAAERGERVRFVFHNRGFLPHDAFIGDTAAQADHERDMRQRDDGHGMHGGGGAITVEPGKTGNLTYTFERTGTIDVGCHQPGHYAAGMKVVVTVA